MRFLALSGSLRAQSINTELLQAAAILARPYAFVELSKALGELPHFNPDLDEEGMTPPATVAALRAEIAKADALLISCPEYAHGVAGSFKNLLDWLVSGPEMVRKRVCILHASASARFGPAALAETLRTMSAHVVTGEAIIIPINGRSMDAAAIVADRELADGLRQALALVAAVGASSQT
jgi:chromate reductase, NAD(P)H dehydrogenase (quinone)